MKNRHLMAAALAAVLVTGVILAGCGKKTDTGKADDASAAAFSDAAAAEGAKADKGNEADATGDAGAQTEEQVGMANPWIICTEEQAKAACPRLFKAPDSAVVNGWTMMNPVNNDSGIAGPMIQLDFNMDGNSFTARAQYGAAEDADIAGAYYDWSGTYDVTLANWGGGNMGGKYSRYMGDDGMADLITWYDYEIGIAYSLFVQAQDLDGFDLQAVAEQMYEPANDPMANVPDEDTGSSLAEYEGQYYIGRGNLTISETEDGSALIQVWWGSSAAEHSEWVMHGTFDEASKTITYSDCERHDFTLNEDGEVEDDVTAYTDGTGSIKLNDDDTIVWTDDQDHIADDLVMSR